MNRDCVKWKEALRDGALAGDAMITPELAAHLQNCDECGRELAALRQRRERMDALLPLLARGAELSTGFERRVIAAAEAMDEGKRRRAWRAWVFVGATVAVVAALLTSWSMLQQRRPPATADTAELAAAQKLAEWHAPSDELLLETPGRQILWSTPRLGESYLNPATTKP